MVDEKSKLMYSGGMGAHENIFDRGALAFRQGMSLDDNPFETGANRIRWEMGWTEAEGLSRSFEEFRSLRD